MANREAWQDIPGWRGLYQASDRGKVRSLTRRVPGRHGPTWYEGKILKTHSTTKYAVVTLSYRSKVEHHNVHTLVLETFVGPCPPGLEACHNDGNAHNCAAKNLRWDTRQANADDRVKHRLERL